MSSLKQSIADALRDSEQRVREEADKRVKRRKELREKDISAEIRIVAWIDILGFSQQLQQARTEAQYRSVYHKLLLVHEMFDAPSASDQPDVIAKNNDDYGRSVMALSDGSVVTASPNAKARTVMTSYDLLMSFIGDIVMAQANCALNGVFLRGGISIGPFYCENNILLSRALIDAYKMETERAYYPVILISPNHVAALRQLKGFKHYAKGWEPSPTYFRPFKSPSRKKGERFLHLDYLRYLAHPDNHGFFCERDRIESLDREKYSPTERQHLFSLSHFKSAARAMRGHKEKLIQAYKATNSERVKAKYRWLMAYQNRTLRGFHPVYNQARIDLQDFSKA